MCELQLKFMASFLEVNFILGGCSLYRKYTAMMARIRGLVLFRFFVWGVLQIVPLLGYIAASFTQPLYVGLVEVH